jgi:hypothetical protein
MLSAGFLAVAETSSIAATDGREGAAGCGGVPVSVDGAARGMHWTKRMADGATCDGGPVCAGGWRSVVAPFRVAAVAGRPTDGGTCSVPTNGSGTGSGNVWSSGNAWGTATVGAAGAGGWAIG